MYQILNLTKRLDAMEVSIEKFATMLETVTRCRLTYLTKQQPVSTLLFLDSLGDKEGNNALKEVADRISLEKSGGMELLVKRVEHLENEIKNCI